MPVLDWQELGAEARTAALDAHDGKLPPADYAFAFVLENPECFGQDEWPAEMPPEAPIEFIAAYYRVGGAQ
jgi:hypothetical protein